MTAAVPTAGADCTTGEHERELSVRQPFAARLWRVRRGGVTVGAVWDLPGCFRTRGWCAAMPASAPNRRRRPGCPKGTSGACGTCGATAFTVYDDGGGGDDDDEPPPAGEVASLPAFAVDSPSRSARDGHTLAFWGVWCSERGGEDQRAALRALGYETVPAPPFMTVASASRSAAPFRTPGAASCDYRRAPAAPREWWTAAPGAPLDDRRMNTARPPHHNHITAA